MSEELAKDNFQDQAINFFKNNKKSLLLSFVAILILAISFLFYKNLQERKDIKTAEQYTQASIFLSQKKNNEAKIFLEDIINNNHEFYSPLALYLMIDKGLEGDSKKIILYFDQIIENSSLDKESKNLIKIKKALYLFSLENESLIIDTLNPIINSDSVWKNQAINLLADYFLSKGEKLKADEYYKLLNTN
tara:strand:- start:628 stop:1200 length:573 start_codon:yes stop_codon:yes gene_type:complete